jgi:hypothetical protein
MKIALALAAALTFLGNTAYAATNEIEVSTGVVCNTQAQVERFVMLNKGDDNAAIKAVNAEAGDPTACGLAALAFVHGHDAVTVRINGATFRIAAILVIGVVTETGMQPVAAPAVQFAPFKIDERTA